MLTTAEAAAFLAERGITVKGHAPSARTVEAWCRKGLLKKEHIGSGRRSLYLVDEAALATFVPPKQGRRRKEEGH